jgi:formate-dependent nitrite reductase cytochrome c552 subunit
MNLNKEDIDALEDAAKKATPGPWCVQHPNAGVRGLEVADRTGLEQICADLTEPRAKYIAAANPAVVLALINKMRELEQKNLRLSSTSLICRSR